MNCSKCGAFIEEGNRFCEECGAPVIKQANTKTAKSKRPRIIAIAVIAAVVIVGGVFLGKGILLSSDKIDLYPMQDNATELVGYVDSDGEWEIEPIYNRAYTFREGYAVVMDQNEKYGTIDKNGDWVIEPKFSGMGDFYEGLAVAQNEDWLCGYVNYDGEWEIEPEYEFCIDFSGGIALVGETNIDYVVIDKSGENIIKSNEVQRVYDVWDGYITMWDNDNEKYYVLDKKGNYVLEDEDVSYRYIGNEMLSDIDNHTIMNMSGETVVQLKENEVAYEVSEEGLIFYEFGDGAGSGIIDSNGKRLIKSYDEYYSDGGEGVILGSNSLYYNRHKYNEYYYIVDKNGNKISEVFQWIEGFKNGISYVETYDDDYTNVKCGCINTKGEWLEK